MKAVINNRVEIVELLLKNGADIDGTNNVSVRLRLSIFIFLLINLCFIASFSLFFFFELD